MASSAIVFMANRWGNWKQSQTLFFGAPKLLQMVTAAIKLKDTCFYVMTNMGSLLKSRDITLPTKVYLVKAMVFPVAMYGRESWTIMKAECRRTDVVLKKTLESSLDSKEIQQSILKEISPEYSLEGMMLKLKLQYLGHRM